MSWIQYQCRMQQECDIQCELQNHELSDNLTFMILDIKQVYLTQKNIITSSKICPNKYTYYWNIKSKLKSKQQKNK